MYIPTFPMFLDFAAIISSLLNGITLSSNYFFSVFKQMFSNPFTSSSQTSLQLTISYWAII